MEKISCVMTTYRRFTCVERSIVWFLSQDYPYESELIIYNTDIQYPLSLDHTFSNEKRIKIINNNIDMVTKKPYTNTGAIRRDACVFADGKYYISWDDDDIFFPFDLRQRQDGIIRTGKRVWKPVKSMIHQMFREPEVSGNYFEASALLYMDDLLKKYGFRLATSTEHLDWYHSAQKEGQLIEDNDSVPAYCFYWADVDPIIGGHKQSGSASRVDNFQHHLENTKDYAKRPLTKKSLRDYRSLLQPFDQIFKQYQISKPDLFNKYIKQYLDQI